MDDRLERYAELVVRVGANVQPGQEVNVLANVEHYDVARALTRQAYRAGASYVNVLYGDPHVRKAMIELGPDEALTYSPMWQKAFFGAMSGNAMSARPATRSLSCSPTSTANEWGEPCRTRSCRSGCSR
jgi:aminopeptidase